MISSVFKRRAQRLPMPARAASRGMPLRVGSSRCNLFSTDESSSQTKMVTVEEHGNVAKIVFDDGKMNIFTFEALAQWRNALDDCEDASALILQGNAQSFSAGFDLSVMGQGRSPEAAAMLNEGGDLVLRLVEWKRPTIICATGHSLALGAILLFSADYRLGVSDQPKAKTGLTEVALGLPVPQFAMKLGQKRLATTHITRSCVLSEVFSSERAVEAGFYDTTVPSSVIAETALSMASGVADYQDEPYQATKKSLWGSTVEEARVLLEADVKGFQ